GRALGAPCHVLLQFVTGVVGQLVIDVQQNIFLYPCTFHRCTPYFPSPLPSCARLELSSRDPLFIACPPESRATSEWLGTKYSLRFLQSCSKSRRQSAISIPDSASTQKPCVHEA